MIEWKQAVKDLSDIMERAGQLPENAEDFAHSIIDSAGDMQEWVEDRERVTNGQLGAIENWSAAIAKWES